MPRYDYRCSSCGHTFEARHSYDGGAPACPACQAPGPRKIIQAVGLIVKSANPSFTPDAGCPRPDECASGGCLGSRFSRN